MSTKTKPRTINVEAIDQVIAKIREKPKANFRMAQWAVGKEYVKTGDYSVIAGPQYVSQDGEPLICKTALCIGGYACATSPVANDRLAIANLVYPDAYAATRKGLKVPWRLKKFRKAILDAHAKGNYALDDIEERAARRLGITRAQSKRLFYVGNWPAKVQDRIDAGKITERAAAIKLLTQIRDGKDPWADEITAVEV